MEIIDQMNSERVLYLFFEFPILHLAVCIIFFSGGILGWDPVLTTCIPGR